MTDDIKAIRDALDDLWSTLDLNELGDQVMENALCALDALEQAQAALHRIAELDPRIDSEEGYNEWGEADCFRQAQKIAAAAMSDAPGA